MRVALFFTIVVLACSAVSAQYVVTGVPDNNSAWLIANNGAAALPNPNITIAAGSSGTITINSVLTAHPFAFGANPDLTPEQFTDLNVTTVGCTNSGLKYVTTNATTPCVITVTVAADAAPGESIYYKCTNHINMHGFLVVGAGAGTGAPTTTAAPSNTPTTTPTPTKTPTKTNNSASVTMPALTSIVLAAAAAVIVA